MGAVVAQTLAATAGAFSDARYGHNAPGRPAVVLLHAATSSGAQWRGVQRALGSRYEVLAPALYAEGGSVPPLPPCAAGMLCADVELVCCALESVGGCAHLVGHSYGGFVAHRVALEHPSMVLSLVLVEPTAFDVLGDPRVSPEARQIETLRRACQEAVERGSLTEAAERFVDYWAAPGTYRALSENQREQIARAMIKATISWREIFSARVDYAATIVPTTIIRGSSSPAPIRHIARVLAGQIAPARLVELRGAGHHAPLTHPAAVAREIRKHIAWCSETYSDTLASTPRTCATERARQ
jgi:pimeloyl-ACP methyl ester carboxylesterase